MKNVLFLALFLSSFTGFAGSANAKDINENLSLSDFRTNPVEFEGRVVEINARVIAINADAKSMELFDSESRSIIKVRLNQLSEMERSVLINGDIRRVAVVGRAMMANGKVTIEAQKVESLPLTATVPTAVVSLAN